MLTTPSASGSSGSTSTTWTTLLIPINAALAVFYLTLRYGAFPGPGDVPILDLIALDRLANEALPVSRFAAPAGVTLPLG
ncbi:MAG: hypothetical protein F4023_13475 [Acidobacteria bacterium]|nr:hypothetical protein [Acidobacteriota bacterium]MYK80653.1 hypothetical protein [Acidobacteriota bacterium]